MIEIHPIAALKDNYIWIIINPQSKTALVVDPGDAKPVFEFLKINSFTLKGILITHHHFDHVNGVVDLIKQNQVPVIGSANSPYQHLTHKVVDEDVVLVDKSFPKYKIISIPGHTMDHIAFYDNTHLFCGDTLFGAGCGRLFEGTASKLYASLQKIAELPQKTIICCAHEYTLNNLRFAQTIEPDNFYIQQRLEHVISLRDKGLPSVPSTLCR